MRGKLTIIVAVLLAMGLLCGAEQACVSRATDGAIAGARDVTRLLQAGELEDALAQARELDARWDEQASLLEMFVNHRATDDVRYAFSRLIAAIEGGDREAALIYAAELEGGVEHVFERQALLIQNVL